jgi:hypothetical protein
MPSDSQQARVAAKVANLSIQQAVNGIDEIQCSSLPINLVIACCSCLHLLTGNQSNQLLRTWLSPADPSTNHNIARKAQHNGTAVWLFQGKIVIEWKSSGSLLWIHGKRAFQPAFFGRTPSDGLRSWQRALGKASSGSFFLTSFRLELTIS